QSGPGNITIGAYNTNGVSVRNYFYLDDVSIEACSDVLQITQQPQPVTYTGGAGASLSVQVTSAAPFTYQWRKYPGPVNLAEGDGYSGTSSSTLTLGPG